MKNKTKDKILITLILVATIVISYFAIDFVVAAIFGKVIKVSEQGTKYIDRGDHIEIVYIDGRRQTIGNEKSEYENNIIGE